MVTKTIDCFVQHLTVFTKHLRENSSPCDCDWGQKIAFLALKVEQEMLIEQAQKMNDDALIAQIERYLKHLYQDFNQDFEAHRLNILTHMLALLEARGYEIEVFPIRIMGQYMRVEKRK
ncbi:MAG: hypothetical protein WBC91_13250 [Phototrophicaceae bacterium]